MNRLRKIKKKILNPSTASPATPNPITVPPENDIFSALGKLALAACVVRTLDCVAIRIPIFPASAEKKAPKMKATTMTQWVVSTTVDTAKSAIEAVRTKIARDRYTAHTTDKAPY